MHFHPGRPFAREALQLNFGKTESWIIVAADAGRRRVPRAQGSPCGARRSLTTGPTSRTSRRDARRDERGARSRPGDGAVRPGRDAARDRRGHPAGRAPGAHRPLGAARVAALRGRRRLRARSAWAGTRVLEAVDLAPMPELDRRPERDRSPRMASPSSCPRRPTRTSAPSGSSSEGEPVSSSRPTRCWSCSRAPLTLWQRARATSSRCVAATTALVPHGSAPPRSTGSAT